MLSGGVVLEEGSHHDLLADPEGPYSKLVAAQKLKEEVAEDGSSNAEENPEDLLAQEKEDLGDELKRAGTSRSAASIALSHRLKAAANAPESNAGILPLFFRIGRLNKGQALSYTLGCIAAVFVSLLSVISRPTSSLYIASVRRVVSYTLSSVVSSGLMLQLLHASH